MTKLNLSLGILFIGTAFLAGNFVACSSSSGGTGTAGSTGSAGTTGAAGGAAGSTGAGGANPAATKPDGTCVPGAYKRMGVCACQEGTPDVCPTVGCIDKKLDAANCGACGMACGAMSTCNGGTCGPAPTVVLPAVAGCTGMTIAVAGGTVYYTDEAHNTVNKVGGTAPIAMGEMGATWLAVSGTNLFWYDKGTKKIRMVAATGGTAADVYANTMTAGDAAAPPEIAGFLVDGTSIYISIGTTVIKAPVAGGAATVVVNEVNGGLPAALALNGTANIVYPATVNGDVDAPKLGGATPAECGREDPANPGNAIMTTCPRLGRSQGELFPGFAAVIAGTAYWIDGTNVKSEKIAAVGTTFDSVSMADATITAAAASTDSIYFGFADPAMPATGGIAKAAAAVNTMNTPPTLLARAQKAPSSVAVDATKVYWSTADCSIASTAK